MIDSVHRHTGEHEDRGTVAEGNRPLVPPWYRQMYTQVAVAPGRTRHQHR